MDLREEVQQKMIHYETNDIPHILMLIGSTCTLPTVQSFIKQLTKSMVKTFKSSKQLTAKPLILWINPEPIPSFIRTLVNSYCRAVRLLQFTDCHQFSIEMMDKINPGYIFPVATQQSDAINQLLNERNIRETLELEFNLQVHCHNNQFNIHTCDLSAFKTRAEFNLKRAIQRENKRLKRALEKGAKAERLRKLSMRNKTKNKY
jgi:hypothetical protein